jgi:hypothetical protein
MQIGSAAAALVITKKADDGNNNFVDYTHGPQNPTVYSTSSQPVEAHGRIPHRLDSFVYSLAWVM